VIYYIQVPFKTDLTVYEPCKQSEDNFITNRKLTSCCQIKTLNRLWKKYELFLLNFARNGESFACLKGEKIHIILESKLEMCQWSIVSIFITNCSSFRYLIRLHVAIWYFCLPHVYNLFLDIACTVCATVNL
jgi:hypothetical protein